MEPDANQVRPATLCKNGCGFYGSTSFEGMCSKCYKDALKRKSETAVQQPSTASATSMTSPMCPSLTDGECSATASLRTGSSTVSGLPVADEADDETAGAERIVQETPEAACISEDSNSSNDNDSSKKKKSRCGVCKKKVGLTGFGCRCGGLFCSLHRYSDKHECPFDYKQLGAEQIRKANPVVQADKIQKI